MVQTNTIINNTCLNDFLVTTSTSGITRKSSITNTSNTASSQAKQVIGVAGTSAGSAWTEYQIAGSTSGFIGTDNPALDIKIGYAAAGTDFASVPGYFLMRSASSDILFQLPRLTVNVNSVSGALLSIQNQNTSATGTAISNVISGGALAGADAYSSYTSFASVTSYCLGYQAVTNKFLMSYNGTGTLSGGLPFFTFSDSTKVTDSPGGNVTRSGSSAFAAFKSATTTNVTGDGTGVTVVCDTVSFDQNSNYNNSTGVFTAPVAGRYQFNINITIGNIGAGHTLYQQNLVTTLQTFSGGQCSPASVENSGNIISASTSFFVNMHAGDTATATMAVINSTKTISLLGNASVGVTTFSGFLAA